MKLYRLSKDKVLGVWIYSEGICFGYGLGLLTLFPDLDYQIKYTAISARDKVQKLFGLKLARRIILPAIFIPAGYILGKDPVVGLMLCFLGGILNAFLDE